MRKNISATTVATGLGLCIAVTSGMLPVRAETLLQMGARKLAESQAGKRLNVAENLDLVSKMRQGEMPPQPKDGGCTTPQSKTAIAEFVQQRARYAELAEYARLVYEREGLQEAVRDVRLPPAKRVFHDVNVNAATSLGYMIVEQAGANGKADITLVFEGSTYKHGHADAINKFVRANLAQLVIKAPPEMFYEAEQIYLATVKQYPPSVANITLTGHSLGGALASFIAAKHDVQAVTFNPARLSQASIDDAAHLRPQILDNRMRNIANITNISSSTDTVHFMGIPGQATYLLGRSFIFQVGTGDRTGHGVTSLATALRSIAVTPPAPAAMCINYYGTDAAWSALKANAAPTEPNSNK